jgi:uncharacterized membrane protein
MIHFAPSLPPWLFAVLGLALIGTTIRFWRRSRLTGLPKAAVLVCRLLAAGLVAFMLAGPYTLVGNSGSPPSLVILADASRSMDFPAGETSRADLARHILREAREAGGSRLAIQPYWFGSHLHDTRTEPAADHPLRLGSRLARSLHELRSAHPAPPSALLILSDGAFQDSAALPGAVAAWEKHRTPIHTLCTGGHHPPRNLSIDFCDAPSSAPPGTRVPITVGIRRHGCPDEPLTLHLLDSSERIIDTASLPGLPATTDGPANEPVSQQATVQAVTSLDGFIGTLKIQPLAAETTEEDNSLPLRIGRTTQRLRILYMEGTNRTDHGIPEPLFLADALDQDGQMDVDILALNVTNDQGGSILVGWPWKQDREFKPDPTRGYPRSREELYAYDVIICSDIPRQSFTDQQIDWTVDFVAERGGAFVMIGGKSSFGSGLWDRTPWDKLIPLDMAGASRGLTFENFLPHWPVAARQHPLLARLPLETGESLDQILDAHPLFLGTNFVSRAKPAATVIMRQHDAEGMPIMAVQSFGKGRTMGFASDVTFFWGTLHNRGWGPPDLAVPLDPNTQHGEARTTPAAFYNNAYFRRFWIQAMRWLAEGSLRLHGASFQASTPAVSWLPGASLPIHASTGDEAMLSKLAQGTCTAAVDGRPDTRTSLRFNHRTRRFEGILAPASQLPAEGEIVVEARAPGLATPQVARFPIRTASADIERATPSARPEPLALASTATGGITFQSAAEVVNWIRSSPTSLVEAGLAVKRPAWDRGPLLAALLALLGVDWLLRRFFS